MVTVADHARVDHESAPHRVEGLHHLHIGKRPLDLFAQRVEIAERRHESRRHTAGEVERIGHIDEDLPVECGSGEFQSIEAGFAFGAVEDDLSNAAASANVPAEAFPLCLATKARGLFVIRAARTHHDIMTKFDQFTTDCITDVAGAEDGNTHFQFRVSCLPKRFGFRV